MTGRAWPLICASHTLGFRNHRNLTLDERCAAARAAGFEYIGWTLEDWRRERASGATPGQISATLSRHGVAVAEIEMLRGWAAPADTADPKTSILYALGDWREQLEDVLHMNDCVKARHVVCAPGDAERRLLPHEAVVENFAHICQRLAGVDLRAVIEFLPWSGLNSLGKAAGVVRGAGQANGGVVLDAWHHFRAGGTVRDVRDVPPETIGLVQVCDAAEPRGDPFEDTMMRRLFPGAGRFPLRELFAELASCGVNAPVSIEMLGEAADNLPVGQAAALSFQSAVEVCGEYLERATAIGPRTVQP